MMLNSWLLTQNCWNNLLPNFLVPLHSKFPFSWTFCLRPWENAFKKVFPGNEASTDSTNVIWQHQVSRKSAALIFQKARTNPSLPLTWSRSKTKQEQCRTPSFRGIKQSYEVFSSQPSTTETSRHHISKATIACAFCAMGIRPEWGTRSEMFHEWFVEWMLCILNFDFPSSNK